jgi:hypothetical protein
MKLCVGDVVAVATLRVSPFPPMGSTVFIDGCFVTFFGCDEVGMILDKACVGKCTYVKVLLPNKGIFAWFFEGDLECKTRQEPDTLLSRTWEALAKILKSET